MGRNGVDDETNEVEVVDRGINSFNQLNLNCKHSHFYEFYGVTRLCGF